MKKNLRYIYLAFSVSIIICVAISFLLIQNLTSLKKYNIQIGHAQKVLSKIQNVQYLLMDAENSQRGFIISHDTFFLSALKKSQELIYPEISTLQNLTESTEGQRQNLIKLKSTVSSRYQVLTQTIYQATEEDYSMFKLNNLKGKKIMNDFNSLAANMEHAELKTLHLKEDQKRIFEKATPKYGFLILIVSVMFLILSFIMIITEFRRRYKYQKELEEKIIELNMSHAELEQIAFIASHDLQEPLRKMRTFGGRLLLLYKDALNDEGRMMLNRIDVAARRMQALIEDMVDYTHLINSDEPAQTVDLNTCLRDAQSGLKNLIEKKEAVITFEELPEIKGYPFQLQLLFTNLIHNAIKFSKEGVPPEIEITAVQTFAANNMYIKDGFKNEPYLLIKVQDNGIGFENEFAKKIFVMFQRLHSQRSGYEGKGIGLSICKRVMTNHNGFISAEGEPGKGATFNLYFPNHEK